MHANERLQHEIMAFIVGVPPVLTAEAQQILMVYAQIQNELRRYAQDARIGLELAVKETVTEAMTHAKLPINVDPHAAKGILERTRDQLSQNLGKLLSLREVPAQEAEAHLRSQHRPK